MAKANTFTYRFDELPLIIDGGFEDQGVRGEAEISYFPDGEWSIQSIGIEVSRFKNAEEMRATGITSKWVRKIHQLDAGTPLFLLIYHRLEHECREALTDAVHDEIANNSPAAWIADHQRDLLKHEERV
jgi:hypothetical protein